MTHVGDIPCRIVNSDREVDMSGWFSYAVAAALLYGLHQVFTKLAADRIGEGVGGLIVEATAAATIAGYVLVLWKLGKPQTMTESGALYSALTGICVGLGTLAFFLLFQKGGPLSAVPAILAAGMALMAVAGFAVFREPTSSTKLLGIVLSMIAIVLLRK